MNEPKPAENWENFDELEKYTVLKKNEMKFNLI